MQRARREVGGHHRVGAGGDQDRRFEGDRLVVRQAQPTQVDDRLARRDTEAGGLAGASTGGSTRVSSRELGTRPARRISWVNVISRFARRWAGGCRHEAAAARLAPDQAVLGQPLHGVPGGHPADAELGAQLGVRGQARAGPQGRDPLAQGLLDLAVVRLVAGLGHCVPHLFGRGGAGPSPRPASAPWIAAPIAPAQVPSSAVTTVDRVERGRVDAPAQLVVDRDPAAGRPRGRDPAADDDPVRRDDDDHVGDADAEVAPDSAMPASARASPARAALDGLLGRGGPAGRRDLVGPGERLEAAAVAAAAPRPVGVDRLVAELAARAVVALVDAAVDGDDAADPGAERQTDHRGRAPARRPGAARPGRTPGRR